MVIHDLAVRPDGEFGGDQTASRFKLPVSAVHAPVDGPVLQAGVRAGSKITLTHCAKPQRMPSAEMDRTRFEEAGFTDIRVGEPVDTFAGASGEAKARDYEVFGYAFMATKRSDDVPAP